MMMILGGRLAVEGSCGEKEKKGGLRHSYKYPTLHQGLRVVTERVVYVVWVEEKRPP